jgi:hypothetical protein
MLNDMTRRSTAGAFSMRVAMHPVDIINAISPNAYAFFIFSSFGWLSIFFV